MYLWCHLSSPHHMTPCMLFCLGDAPCSEFWYCRCAREGLCGKCLCIPFYLFKKSFLKLPLPFLPACLYLISYLGTLGVESPAKGPALLAAWRGGVLFYHLVGDGPLCELQGREHPGVSCSSRNSENYPSELTSEADLNQQYRLRLRFLICQEANFYLQFYFFIAVMAHAITAKTSPALLSTPNHAYPNHSLRVHTNC